MLIDFERVFCALMASEIEPNRDQVRQAALIIIRSGEPHMCIFFFFAFLPVNEESFSYSKALGRGPEAHSLRENK